MTPPRKRILIMAGSAGVGAAVARRLAEQGVRVAINYSSNETRAQATLASLPGSDHVLIQGNAMSKEEIQRIVESAVQNLGGLDAVVSNVGWTAFGPFNDLEALSDDDWMQCYNGNVMSHLWLMQACRTELEKSKGCMIVTASVAGLKPSGSSMAYGRRSMERYLGAVSKAATIHLVKSLAIACAPCIRVNCVAAGVMLTDWSKGFTEEHIRSVKEGNALKQVCDIEDVAQTYVGLIENRSMTGQCIEISAGFRL